MTSTSSYHRLFCDEKRPEVMKQLQEEAADGKLKMADMGKKLGDMWKEVADKTKWETVAAEQKKSYEAKLEEWKKSAEYKEYLKVLAYIHVLRFSMCVYDV